MKTVTLLNPEAAQKVFTSNGWTDTEKFYIKISDDNAESVLVNAEAANQQGEGNALNIKVGSTYEISLAEFDDMVSIEFEDIQGLGALLRLNGIPYMLYVFKNAVEEQISTIGSVYPELRIINFGSAKNETIRNLQCINECAQLETLNLDNCPNLDDISLLPSFSKLDTLWLDGFSREQQFAHLGKCSALRRLSQNRSNLSNLKHLESLLHLQVLSLGNNSTLNDISGLSAIINLTTLKLNSCKSILDITPLGNLTNLTNLSLAYCDSIQDITPLGNLTTLTTLNLPHCKLVFDITPLSNLTNLSNLNLAWCKSIQDITPLGKLTNLSNLNLAWCKSIQDITPLGNLTNLSNLNLAWCESIQDITPLGNLRTLTTLNLHRFKSIQDITPLGNLITLTTLNLKSCELIQDITPLGNLTTLTALNLNGCESIQNITPLGKLTNLSNLNISYCESIQDITPLSNLSKLTTLNLEYSKSIQDITPLGNLTNLTSLSISSCNSIQDITPLGNLTNLTSLSISSCNSIQDITPLAKLNKLTSLNMGRCKNLTFIYPLINNDLSVLETLEIDISPNIRDFALLGKLKHLKELTWIDPVACSEVLMQSALNREDVPFIEKNIKNWNSELLLCKDANLYASLLLSCVNLLPKLNQVKVLQDVAQNMRARGLQSETQNDLEPFIWEKWCAMVTALPYREASDCLSFVTNELNLEKETFVLLGPVVLACADLVDNNPENEKENTAWVGEQLALLAEFPHLERQIAPSAAVYYASIQEQSKVEQWLIKATDEKMPLWRERVLTKLVGFYGAKQQFSKAKNLLAQMGIQEEKDEALAALSLSMASVYPVDAAFLLDEIHQNSIVVQTAKTLLHSESVLAHPQGIYQLFLHLQNTPEELEHCLSSLIEQDKSGKVAEAIQKLFVTPVDTNGTSTAAFLLLCEHPGLNDFVKPRALQKYKDNLLGKSKNEAIESTDAFVLDLLEQGLIEMEEVNEITLALKN
jgi:Leucine-rich repeat (LRR) protein